MKRTLWVALLVVAFLGTCSALLRPAARIADPMTHHPFPGGLDLQFPVLVVDGVHGVVHLMKPPYAPPVLTAGQTFLIPRGATPGGHWNLEVENIAPDRQRVELYRVDDGYSGGVYEATRTTVRPLYRKITGPGFAFVFGGIALAINMIGWLLAALIFRAVRLTQTRDLGRT
jgi:hypothetical protein